MQNYGKFKGTVSYASLNAHRFEDLSRRDDMWSFFFIILEFLGAKLPWRSSSDNLTFEQVKESKMRSLENLNLELFATGAMANSINEVRAIFNAIDGL